MLQGSKWSHFKVILGITDLSNGHHIPTADIWDKIQMISEKDTDNCHANNNMNIRQVCL